MNSEGNTTKSFGIKIKNVRLTVNAKEKVNGYLGCQKNLIRMPTSILEQGQIHSYMKSMYLDLIGVSEEAINAASPETNEASSVPIPAEEPYTCSFCKTASFNVREDCLAHAKSCISNPRECQEQKERNCNVSDSESTKFLRDGLRKMKSVFSRHNPYGLVNSPLKRSTLNSELAALSSVSDQNESHHQHLDLKGQASLERTDIYDDIQLGFEDSTNSTRERQEIIALRRIPEYTEVSQDPGAQEVSELEQVIEVLSPELPNIRLFDSEQIPAPLDYEYVHCNHYSAAVKRDQIFKCECSENTTKCSDDSCLNRGIQIECGKSCGPFCMNRRLQTRKWAPGLITAKTAKKGKGIFTTLPISKGDLLLEICGEVIQKKEFERRMTTIYKDDVNHFCMNLEKGLVIDCRSRGNEGRTVNHSCDPNCEVQKWSAEGLTRVALFAARDINVGEEITYDYKFQCFNQDTAQACYCESTNCRQWICPPPVR